jgi:GT2 family glycosyltransferase
VVVPTRNRVRHAVGCAQSILATDGFTELIVVDQSDDCLTRQALGEIRDPRLRYVQTETRGVANGRNLGMDLSRGDIIAFTDDDCRVKPDWVQCLIDVFVADPDVAVVCGQVRVPEEIRHLGWAESFHPHEREWQGRYPPLGEWGITANLSLRRSILGQVGPFDPMLGAGAPLPSGGEPDFLFRVLRVGLKVVNAEEVLVEHLGVRQHGHESSTLIRGYGVGTGAAFLKHIRLGDARAALVYVRFLASTTVRVISNLLFRRKPTGAGFLLALLSGALASYRYGIDRERRQYVAR